MKAIGKCSAAVILVLGTIVLPESSASAVTCTYNGCAGKDPEQTGCANDAVSWEEFSGRYDTVVVSLRYSAACHSVWVRVKDDCVNETRYVKPYMETGYVDYYSQYHLQGRFLGPSACIGGNSVWTPMSSSRRERIRYGYARYEDGTPFETYVHLTGCNDCY